MTLVTKTTVTELAKALGFSTEKRYRGGDGCMSARELADLLAGAFIAGFLVSAEGFNGEYCNGNVRSDRDVIDDPAFQKELGKWIAEQGLPWPV